MFKNLLILSNVGESKTTKQQSLTIDAAASSQSAQFSAATCDGQLGRNKIFCHPTVHTSLVVASTTPSSEQLPHAYAYDRHICFSV